MARRSTNKEKSKRQAYMVLAKSHEIYNKPYVPCTKSKCKNFNYVLDCTKCKKLRTKTDYNCRIESRKK